MDVTLSAFPPIVGPNPHTLILGTMPGQKSLTLGQYYAHPQNQFWRLMGDIYGALPSLPYETRVDILKNQGIAVWDVLASCSRSGSMDADIKNPVANDFAAFFEQYSSIECVVFDSLTAVKLYDRLVLPGLARSLSYKRVPSPSPAYARLTYAGKLALWSAALRGA